MTEAKRAAKQAGSRGMAGEAPEWFTVEEREAMKERARELEGARRSSRASQSEGEADVQVKTASMPEPDRAAVPELSPRTWYGMPAYASNGVVVCFFQGAHKFKTRYATLGFSDKANLDAGALWPTAYALKELAVAEEETIVALVKRAVQRPEAAQ
jgi:uncharacterized protein YdhG (YjbR/CyaY superfamily)